MKRMLLLPLLALLGLSVPTVFTAPYSAQAQVNDHYSVPLAVVRFNQPRVYFQRPIANAVRKAMQVSPDVSFNIVHYAPGGDRQRVEKAERNLQSVLKHLYGLGVRPEKVQIRKQVAAGLPHSEVHLYVR